MSKIIRFFRRILHLDPTDDPKGNRTNKNGGIEYIITRLLDEPPYVSHIPKKYLANELFKEFYTYIGLLEDQDYFGLKNSDDIWINPSEYLYKQVHSKPPFHLRFCVKFYPSDPQNLHDEFARFLMVQQISNDIQTEKLKPDNLDLVADLSALLLQSWYGPYDSREHTLNFIKTHQFLPAEKCTESFFQAVLSHYAKNSYSRLVPAEADKIFLKKVTQIPLFGVDWHSVEGKGGTKIRLGLNPSGILVYEQDENAGLFLWNQIDNIVLKWKKIKIIMEIFNDETGCMESSEFVFRSSSHDRTKELFKSCAEYHIFYQLTTSQNNPKPTRTPSFFRRNSIFSLSSRTEFEMHQQRSLGSSSLRRQKSSKSFQNSNSSEKTNVSRSHTMHSFKRAPSRSMSMSRPKLTSPNAKEDLRERI